MFLQFVCHLLSTNYDEFLEDWEVRLETKDNDKRVDFAGDPDHDYYPGILSEFLSLRCKGNIVRIVRD